MPVGRYSLFNQYKRQGKTSEQTWQPGQEVKVGFMKLRVLGMHSEKDYLPDMYLLESLDGAKLYEFIPHHGLSRIDEYAESKILEKYGLDEGST